MTDKIEEILFCYDTPNKEIATYAILDASGNDEVYHKALFYNDRFSALFEEEELETVSPYLVKMENEDEVTAWILQNYKDANWISFIQSNKPYNELLQTLTSFTKVYDEEEEHDVYIRYWDPRAMEIVLDMFGEDGREVWFESIEAMYARDTLEENRMLKFSKEGKTVISLSSEEV